MMVCSVSSNDNLQSSGGQMQLQRNGYSISEGDCTQVVMIHLVTIREEDEGEYRCMGYLPHNNDTTQSLYSDIRDLEVLSEYRLYKWKIRFMYYLSHKCTQILMTSLLLLPSMQSMAVATFCSAQWTSRMLSSHGPHLVERRCLVLIPLRVWG